MEKVRPWCGQPSDRRRLRNGTEQGRIQKAWLGRGVGCGAGDVPPIGEGSGERAMPFPGKMIFFSLETAWFGG